MSTTYDSQNTIEDFAIGHKVRIHTGHTGTVVGFTHAKLSHTPNAFLVVVELDPRSAGYLPHPTGSDQIGERGMFITVTAASPSCLSFQDENYKF